MRKILTLSILVLFSYEIQAQKAPIKWGKVTDQEWELTRVDYNPDASAVILCDYGVATFAGNKLRVTYHKRIKILSKESLDEADIQIPYYTKDRIQNVTSLKAQTMNLVNGKVQVNALNGKQIFQEKVSEEWSAASFAFPEVQVGSILEYSYVLSSENVVFLRSWDFQNEHPTIHSEFRAAIPTYLDYKVFFQGSRLVSKYKDAPKSEWFLRNVPALKPEPFITTMEDYREKIRFQLAGYYTSGSGISATSEYRTLMTTWESLGKELMTNLYFGDQLSKKAFSKDLLEQLLLEGKSPQAKMELIYNYVRKNIQWDQDYDAMASRELKEVLKEKSGTSAEVNLLLINLLSNAGLNVDPVLISTRSHGIIAKNIPLLTQFNHVIARAQIGEEVFFLDAIDPLRPFNLLAQEDLNQHGLMIKEKSDPEWVEITPPTNNLRNVIVTVNLEDLTKPTATFSTSYTGYYALESRRKVSDGNEDIVPTHANVSPFEIEYDNLAALEKPLGIKSNEFDIEVVDNGALVYVQPLMLNYYQENPFKSPKRTFPIDFGSPFKEMYAISINIPEGYSVEELPESTAIKLPRNYGHFQYLSEIQDRKVQIVVRMGISKPSMGYGLYDGLVQFYDIMISKLNAQLVLRKD